MILEHPKQLIAIGISLMVFGVVVPFLMVLHIVESTFFWNFLSFGASVLGLFLGIAGIAGTHISSKHKDRDENHYKQQR